MKIISVSFASKNIMQLELRDPKGKIWKGWIYKQEKFNERINNGSTNTKADDHRG